MAKSVNKPSESVQALLAEARRDYVKHNQPETRAAAQEQSEQAKFAGKAAATRWHGRRT